MVRQETEFVNNGIKVKQYQYMLLKKTSPSVWKQALAAWLIIDSSQSAKCRLKQYAKADSFG